MARQPLCINNQCHQIAQSSAIKVLLRHLVRRYTTKCINNYAYSTKREGFLFEKEFDLLKPLTDFSIRGACPYKLSGQPLCKDYSRLHLEELRQNYWSSPSSNSWQLDETTRLDCATTLAPFVGRLNQKHISMMTNTSNVSQ